MKDEYMALYQKYVKILSNFYDLGDSMINLQFVQDPFVK